MTPAKMSFLIVVMAITAFPSARFSFLFSRRASSPCRGVQCAPSRWTRRASPPAKWPARDVSRLGIGQLLPRVRLHRRRAGRARRELPEDVGKWALRRGQDRLDRRRHLLIEEVAGV